MIFITPFIGSSLYRIHNFRIQVRDGEWKTKKFFNTPEENLKWISIYIGDDYSRPDRDGCTRDDFEQKWCQAFVNVGQELGVKIGRPLEQITVRGYEDFYNKIEGEWKKENKDICK